MPSRFWPVIHHPFIQYLSYIDSLINLPRSRTPPPPPHASCIDIVHGTVGRARQGTASDQSPLVNFHRPPYGTIILPQALSSGTSIHSPAVSHPVNKRILVACIMIPARRRANRHNQATLAWLVAMSPSPAATLSRIGGTALVDLDCTCAFALLSSVAQLHFPIPSPLWYLGKQATEGLLCRRSRLYRHQACICFARLCPRSCVCCITLRQVSQQPKVGKRGKEPADELHSNSKADLGCTKVSSSSLLDSASES